MIAMEEPPTSLLRPGVLHRVLRPSLLDGERTGERVVTTDTDADADSHTDSAAAPSDD
jgi:hypothetical protein